MISLLRKMIQEAYLSSLDRNDGFVIIMDKQNQLNLLEQLDFYSFKRINYYDGKYQFDGIPILINENLNNKIQIVSMKKLSEVEYKKGDLV